jgi:serine/threonine protein kinase
MLAEDPAHLAGAAQGADSKPKLAPDCCWNSSGAPAFVPAAELTGKTGSFGYMAPEVLHSRQYDAMVDIFSLGMCM